MTINRKIYLDYLITLIDSRSATFLEIDILLVLLVLLALLALLVLSVLLVLLVLG